MADETERPRGLSAICRPPTAAVPPPGQPCAQLTLTLNKQLGRPSMKCQQQRGLQRFSSAPWPSLPLVVCASKVELKVVQDSSGAAPNLNPQTSNHWRHPNVPAQITYCLTPKLNPSSRPSQGQVVPLGDALVLQGFQNKRAASSQHTSMSLYRRVQRQATQNRLFLNTALGFAITGRPVSRQDASQVRQVICLPVLTLTGAGWAGSCANRGSTDLPFAAAVQIVGCLI